MANLPPSDAAQDDLKIQMIYDCPNCDGTGQMDLRSKLGEGCTLVSGPSQIPCKACEELGIQGFAITLDTFVTLVEEKLNARRSES